MDNTKKINMRFVKSVYPHATLWTVISGKEQIPDKSYWIVIGVNKKDANKKTILAEGKTIKETWQRAKENIITLKPTISK